MAITRSAEDTQTGLGAPSKTWLVACMPLKWVHAFSLLLLKASALAGAGNGWLPKAQPHPKARLGSHVPQPSKPAHSHAAASYSEHGLNFSMCEKSCWLWMELLIKSKQVQNSWWKYQSSLTFKLKMYVKYYTMKQSGKRRNWRMDDDEHHLW